ncbi:MAG: branched-chain amino acid transporter permease [Burkholderiaceae bacterium]
MNPTNLNPWYVLTAIALVAAITWALRALPFLAARWLRDQPTLARATNYVPTAILVTLLVHAMANTDNPSQALPLLHESLSVAAVALLQAWLRQPLLSMGAGTMLYVLLRAA